MAAPSRLEGDSLTKIGRSVMERERERERESGIIQSETTALAALASSSWQSSLPLPSPILSLQAQAQEHFQEGPLQCTALQSFNIFKKIHFRNQIRTGRILSLFLGFIKKIFKRLRQPLEVACRLGMKLNYHNIFLVNPSNNLRIRPVSCRREETTPRSTASERLSTTKCII